MTDAVDRHGVARAVGGGVHAFCLPGAAPRVRLVAPSVSGGLMRFATGHEPLAPLRAISPVGLDFPALFEEHYDEIARYLARRLMEPSIAEDIAQNTFVEAYDRRATYDPEREAHEPGYLELPFI